MDEQPLTLSELLDQAAAASALGDRDEARRLYKRATERSPGNSRAWLGLAAASDSLGDKRAYFERVLEINPNNSEARTALKRLAALAEGEEAVRIQAALEKSAAAAFAENASKQPDGQMPDAEEPHGHAPVDGGEALFCVNHPETETTLRCNRCGKPVCYKCVERTPVGYRCKDCIREQQDVFFTAVQTDYIIAAMVSFVLAAIAAPIISAILGGFGFFSWIIAFVAGPFVGGIAATIIRRAVGKRRGRYMGLIVVVAIVLGIIAGNVMLWMVFWGMPFAAAIIGTVTNLTLIIFAVTALGSIYATLR